MQKSEVAVMSIANLQGFEGSCLAGGLFHLSTDKAYPVFDPVVLQFFDELSKVIRKSPDAKRFSDLQTFAFFCRRASLKRYQKHYSADQLRLGWGLSVHVAPANVPVNLAFTLLFGLLAGNKCLVRAPTQPFDQLNLLYKALNSVCQLECFSEFSGRFAVVSCDYTHSDWLEALALADTRVIWGGDDTVQEIRRIQGASKCIEVAFPDRTSFCVVDAAEIAQISQHELELLAEGFFNDTLLMDQNACSSPISIFWLNSNGHDDVVVKFWSSVAGAEHRLGPLGVKKYIDKLAAVGRLVNDKIHLSLTEFGLGVLVDTGESKYDSSEVRLGYFCEHRVDSISDLIPYITRKTQTITYFGVDPGLIADSLVAAGVLGVDRVVPIGKALDLGFIWDGKDIIKTLSRRISVQ
jgi:hypothetical protein